MYGTRLDNFDTSYVTVPCCYAPCYLSFLLHDRQPGKNCYALLGSDYKDCMDCWMVKVEYEAIHCSVNSSSLLKILLFKALLIEFDEGWAY